jgi:hypothetical protein
MAEPDAVIDEYEQQTRGPGHSRPILTTDDRAHLVSLIRALPDPASLSDPGVRKILDEFIRADYEWFYGLGLRGVAIGSAAKEVLEAAPSE